MKQVDGMPERVSDRIIAVLSDGKWHSRKELLDCLQDPMASFQNLYFHVTRARAKVEPLGELILCRYGPGKSEYKRAKVLDLSS